LKQPVWYFWPIRLHLGSDISIISGQLIFDTTKYSRAKFDQRLKEYTLKRSDLDKLKFNNNYADSMKLYFYKDRLFTIDIYASENRRVEYLKFGIRGKKKMALGGSSRSENYGPIDTTFKSIDTTFNYGKYRELRYNSRDRDMKYQYYEDIVDNVAMLIISNERMLKTMPPRKFHE
jgi:hypothetical protein